VSKYARKLGLAPLAKENESVLLFIASLGAAPLLPMYLIWPGVLEIWREVELAGWGAELRPLFEYWEKEWKPRLNELSVFNDPDRTNNCSETDNRMMANCIPQDFPNTWFLIGNYGDKRILS